MFNECKEAVNSLFEFASTQTLSKNKIFAGTYFEIKSHEEKIGRLSFNKALYLLKRYNIIRNYSFVLVMLKVLQGIKPDSDKNWEISSANNSYPTGLQCGSCGKR